MKGIQTIFKSILAILFLLCLLDLPYGYYQLVRFIGMVGFAILAWQQYKKDQVWFVIWLSAAVLINPIFKITLGREVWKIVDVMLAVTLLISIFIDRKKSGQQ